MQMKTSLIQVSRAWYIAGLKFLYEDLIITDARHTVSLNLHLQRNPSLPHLVKRIVLSCYIPESWGALASEHLEELIAICPNARSFWDVTRCHSPPSFKGYLPRRAQNQITHLNLTGKFALIHAEDILRQSAPNLVSLAIPTLPYLSSRDNQGDGALVYPRLETLRDPTFLQNHAFGQFPSLTSLTTDLPYALSENFEAFRSLGKQLGYLAIAGDALRRHAGHGNDLAILQSVISVCPNVKHLVLVAQEVVSAPQSLTHPGVKWLDIWRPMFSGYKDGRLRTVVKLWKGAQRRLMADGFPKLKNVRTLCSSLKGRSPDLPIALPPDAISDPSHDYAIKWCDFDLIVEFKAIYCVEPLALPEEPVRKQNVSSAGKTFYFDDYGWTPTLAEGNEDHTSDASDSDSESGYGSSESELDDQDMEIDIPDPCDYTDFNCPEAGRV